MPTENAAVTSGVITRAATARDVPVILSLIKELAEYEHLSHEVVATEEGLEKTLFGPKSFAEVLLAEAKGEACGFCLFFHNYSTFLARPGLYIEDIFVKPHYRGRGVGKTLFAHMQRIARDRDCGRMEWWVLDWNQPAIDFYTGIGAKPMDEWTVYRLTEEQLKRVL
jgi:GNAT superfamily N-acetyltransferase